MDGYQAKEIVMATAICNSVRFTCSACPRRLIKHSKGFFECFPSEDELEEAIKVLSGEMNLMVSGVKRNARD